MKQQRPLSSHRFFSFENRESLGLMRGCLQMDEGFYESSTVYLEGLTTEGHFNKF